MQIKAPNARQVFFSVTALSKAKQLIGNTKATNEKVTALMATAALTERTLHTNAQITCHAAG